MKKRLLLSILSILAMTSCTGSAINSFNSSSETSSSVEDLKDWTTEQKKMMSFYLYGVILPYLDIGEAEFDYDTDDGSLLITGTKTLDQNALQAYSKLYKEEDDWENAQAAFENEYAFERKIQTDKGLRFLEVAFYLTNEESLLPLDKGFFVLVAHDPYVYEFPKAMFEKGIKEYLLLDSQVQVPSFKADYYLINSKRPEVMCFTSVDNAEDTYKTTLEQANFTILEQKDDYGSNIAISSDKKYAVCYQYNSSVGGLDIYLDRIPELPSEKWPEEGLKEAFTKYKQDFFDVPKFTCDGATYLGHEDKDNWQYDFADFPDRIKYVIEVYNATEEAFNTYISTTLTSASWVEDKSSENDAEYKAFTKAIERKVAKIEVKFDQESKLALINVYLVMAKEPNETWPKEEVKEAIINNKYIDDQLPALDSDKVTKYQVHEADGYGYEPAYVEAFCDEKDVEEVSSAYKLLLTSNNWKTYDGKWDSIFIEIDEENDYISPNGELIVDVKKNKNSVSIIFAEAPIKSWPTKFVSKEFEEHNFKDELPALTGDQLTFKYEVAPFGFSNGFKINVKIDNYTYGGEFNNEKLIEQYVTLLTSAKYTQSTRDEQKYDNEKIYDSPNKEFEVIINPLGNDELDIYINPLTSN